MGPCLKTQGRLSTVQGPVPKFPGAEWTQQDNVQPAVSMEDLGEYRDGSGSRNSRSAHSGAREDRRGKREG